MIGKSFDEVLVAARSGEEWALEFLYRSLAPPVLGYIRGSGMADFEDLTSEVFVAVTRHLHRFEGDEAAFRSWVFSIAHRRMADERRRLARRPEVATDPVAMTKAVEAVAVGNVEEEALARLRGQWALRLLGRLTREQRDVLLLRVLADLSVEQVAAILGRSPGAVKALQRRALRRLARTIDREAVP
jgi:RNA polymerase sigma-70 factor (ECF subfamily)